MTWTEPTRTFVKRQLAECRFDTDEWDGNTIVAVSAKFRKNIEDLLEAITWLLDSMEIQANPRDA